MAKVGVIGVGLIGRAWAAIFARAGWDVALWDNDQSVLAAAPETIEKSIDDLTSQNPGETGAQVTERIYAANDIAGLVKDADLVQENGPEEIEIKRELYEKLDAVADPHTILASSSSALVASRFTEHLPGRARCLIAHPVNPPHVVPIVELCGAPWTDPNVVKRARQIYEGVGQVAIEVKQEIDGFILNRMQAVLLGEAFRLIAGGYVSAEDLDKTIKDGLGRRWAFMGPIETIELNAPGGITDYCERYGAMLLGLSSATVDAQLWSAENYEKVAESWGDTPTAEYISEKSAWRDERLAALDAHLKTSPGFTRG
ncbi:MAG: 3-hydroxyacyl-CoA dehydrogenase [Hyphomicrobiales bacterium]